MRWSTRARRRLASNLRGARLVRAVFTAIGMQEDPWMRPRERLSRAGPSCLSDVELISLLLGTGTQREPVELLAGRVLQRLGGLQTFSQRGVGAFQRIAGVGPTKASRLVAAVELGKRAWARPPRKAIRTSQDVYDLCSPRLGKADREHFIALALSSRGHLVAEREVAVGGLAHCPVSIAAVFRAILREAADSVIFVHNHPSGDPAPSPEDAELTERLCRAAALLEVRVLDHVVIGAGHHFSFRDAGVLPGVS